MAAPPSQKYRTIGFYLSGGGAAPVLFNFVIRPEDLTYPEPSRLSVQQTLGGAWADSFDRGLASLTLSGNHGWRGGALLSGEDLYAALRDTVFVQWHARRAAAVRAGQDPAGVTLQFNDSLDSIRVIVAPQNFTLRRSRSAPLLMRYQVDLTVLADADAATGLLDEIVSALSNPLRWLAGVTGLTSTVTAIQAQFTGITNAIGGITAGAQTFLNTGVGILTSVGQTAANLRGQFDSTVSTLLTVGQSYAAAGANAFSALACDDTLPASQRIPLMSAAALLNDAACTLANSFNADQTLLDLTAIYGASTCSSTGGGDPPSLFTQQDVNPLASLYPTLAPPITVTPAAQQALATLGGDPLALVGQHARIAALLGTAGGGVALAA